MFEIFQGGFMMSENNKILSWIARTLGSNIPGKGISVAAYYVFLKNKVAKTAKQQNLSVEEYLEKEFRLKLEQLDLIPSDQDLLDLANDLAIAFAGDRKFRKGWVIDGYFKVYERCNNASKTLLDGLTGF